jgi:hypothetical protein
MRNLKDAMKTLEMSDHSAVLMKESVSLKLRMLESKRERYRTDLQGLEKRHGMDSEDLYKRFSSGELGDKKQWFRWVYLWETLQSIEKRIHRIRKDEIGGCTF